MMFRRARRTAERGTSSVELALIVPMFLLMLVGVFDMSWLVILSNMTGEAAREGARAGMVLVRPNGGACPVSVPGAAVTAIGAAARNQVVAFGAGTYNVTPQTRSGGTQECYLEVTVQTTYQPIVAALLPFGSKTVGATSRLAVP